MKNFKRKNNYSREFVSGICGAAGAMLFNLVATEIQKKIEEKKMKDLVTKRVFVERRLSEYDIWSRRAAEKALKKGTINEGVYKEILHAFDDIDRGYAAVYEANDPTSQFVEAVVGTTH